MFSRAFPFLCIVIFSLIATLPLFHQGLLPTHDGEYHIVRFYEFHKMILDGVWYPRWAPDLLYGLGVPLFNYVYPLPNYMASLFHFFGASFIDTFKLQMALATVLGAVFFYLWSSKFWGTIGGITASVLYTFSPYHLVDIYVRGSVGEVWALALFPFHLWAISLFLLDNKKKAIPLISISLALIIFSHNILALMFFGFSLSYAVFLVIVKKINITKTVLFAISLVLGLGISAMFWIPAIFENQYVTGLQIYEVEDHFVELYQLIFPSWGTGFSAGEMNNQMSFQIGIVNMLAVAVSIVLIGVICIKRAFHGKGIVAFFLFWFFITIYFMLPVSSYFWRQIPLLSYFQFPWRLLSLEALFASFLGGYVVSVFRSRLFSYVFILMAILLTIGYTKPAYYLARDDSYYITRSNFIDGTNSPGNVFNTIWMREREKREKEKLQILNGSGVVILQNIRPSSFSFLVEGKTNLEILLYTSYFPGWTIFVDGQQSRMEERDGIMMFSVSKGRHFVEAVFLDTMVRRISWYIAFVSFFGIIVIAMKPFFKKLYENRNRYIAFKKRSFSST